MMILIRLDSGDWLNIDNYVFYMLGPEYIGDLQLFLVIAVISCRDRAIVGVILLISVTILCIYLGVR